jgi:hypothetical protein
MTRGAQRLVHIADVATASNPGSFAGAIIEFRATSPWHPARRTLPVQRPCTGSFNGECATTAVVPLAFSDAMAQAKCPPGAGNRNRV